MLLEEWFQFGDAFGDQFIQIDLFELEWLRPGKVEKRVTISEVPHLISSESAVIHTFSLSSRFCRAGHNRVAPLEF